MARSSRTAVACSAPSAWAIQCARRAMKAIGWSTRSAGRACTTGAISAIALSVLLPDHELETGPGLIDRAHLDIDQPERQRQLADGVLGDVGGDFRRLLRPRDPDRAVGLELRECRA